METAGPALEWLRLRALTRYLKVPAPRATLESTVALLVALLEAAYAASLRRSVATSLGRTSKVADRDLGRLLDEIIPEVLEQSEGIDGQLAWMLAMIALQRRKSTTEADLLRSEPDAAAVFDCRRFWRRFAARAAFSTAGLEWGARLRSYERRCS